MISKHLPPKHKFVLTNRGERTFEVRLFNIYRCIPDEAPLFFPVFETELRDIEYDIAKENSYLKHFKIKWEPLIRNKFIEDVVI